MEQKQQEYEKQANFENGINILLDMIARAQASGLPYYSELKALYLKILPFLGDDRKEIQGIYSRLESNLQRIYDEKYKELYKIHGHMSDEKKPSNWKFLPTNKIVIKAKLTTYFKCEPGMEKLYLKLLIKLDELGLILKKEHNSKT